jgi:hypothetical protein
MWPRGNTFHDVMIGAQEGGLYKLKGWWYLALIHDTLNPNELWHMIFYHLHYKSLPSVRKMVTGIPEIQAKPDDVCKGCAQGKNVKHSFPRRDNKAKRVSDIVHSNVCEPISTNSLSGYAYCVSFIDDYPHKTWIYLLKAKNEWISHGQNLMHSKMSSSRSLDSRLPVSIKTLLRGK